MTKLLVSFSLVGALIGGIPGAVFAFIIAGVIESGETVCCVANVLLSISGAFAGMLVAKAISGDRGIQPGELVLPSVFGMIFGVVGYVWLDWSISHANPPL